MTVARTLLLAFALTLTAPHGRGDPTGVEFFETKVRPILVERCYGCHSVESGKSKGQLRLDSRDGVLKGGESGVVIVPGKPDESLLIRAVRHTDERLQMPPKEPLSQEQVAALEQWVRIGAPDPRTTATSRPRDHWALKAVRSPRPPDVRDDAWPAGPIDRFVLARLEEKGLSPSQPATKRELLRRATFDLTGLPPTPEEIDAFLSDDSPAAYARVVDRLLASPRYGERWGRHWLDVVRFGESHGYEQNHLRDRAWPYRDYVIRSFNRDTPYTQFVAEQLAADVVASPDEPLAQAATGFLVAGVHDTVGNNTEAGQRQQRADDLDDIVSTVGATFLGLTVGCAKCHDHKFDPIPQSDYYALTAVFAGVRHEERAVPGLVSRDSKGSAATRPAVGARRNVDEFSPVPARFVRFTVLTTRDGTEPCIDELEVYAGDDTNLALAAAGAKATASSLLPNNPIHQVHQLNDGRYGNEHSWISNERGGGWAQIELARERPVTRVVWSRDNAEQPRYSDRVASRYRIEISLDGRKWTTVATHEGRATSEEPKAYIGAFSTPEPVYLLRRGDVMQRGDAVSPSGLTQIPGLPGALGFDPTAPESARRVALARWICDARNPLTARVMVNRVWQHHFGRGLVPTPSDFGANGEPPSHPQLLDWLADDFVKGGWTLKRLHRQIVLSRTYQQTGRPDDARMAAGLAADGGNMLLWRMPLRRLEAEAVRDSILAASGKLDLSPGSVGGPGFRLFNYRVVNIALYDARPDQGPQTWRRAVYQQTARNIHDELLAAFDEPENAQRSPRREVTTNPLQALTLLHSPLVVRQSEMLAERVEAYAGSADVDAQVAGAFRLTLGRPPADDERAAAVDLVRRHGLPALCRGLFNTNEFLTY
jgi:hypothetical protein